MKNEKLSEVVKAVCLMARYGVQKRYSPNDATARAGLIV